MLAEADAEAERIRGRGEAEATRILNDAHARDPRFYEFLRTLEAYRALLDEKTTVVLSSVQPAAPPLDPRAARRAVAPKPRPPRRRPPPRRRRRRMWSARRGRSHEASASWLLLLLAIAALAYLATGLVSVAPGEVVVVRRLGRVVDAALDAGLHWGWPLGIDRRDRVRIDAVRRLEIGLAGVAGPGRRARAPASFSRATATSSRSAPSCSIAWPTRSPSSGTWSDRERLLPPPGRVEPGPFALGRAASTASCARSGRAIAREAHDEPDAIGRSLRARRGHPRREPDRRPAAARGASPPSTRPSRLAASAPAAWSRPGVRQRRPSAAAARPRRRASRIAPMPRPTGGRRCWPGPGPSGSSPCWRSRAANGR